MRTIMTFFYDDVFRCDDADALSFDDVLYDLCDDLDLGVSYACRPVSAYAMFFRDTQTTIKKEQPAATFGEVSKMVAGLWDNLQEDKKAVRG